MVGSDQALANPFDQRFTRSSGIAVPPRAGARGLGHPGAGSTCPRPGRGPRCPRPPPPSSTAVGSAPHALGWTAQQPVEPGPAGHVHAHALTHPGVSDSGLGRHAPVWMRPLLTAIRPLISQSAAMGALPPAGGDRSGSHRRPVLRPGRIRRVPGPPLGRHIERPVLRRHSPAPSPATPLSSAAPVNPVRARAMCGDAGHVRRNADAQARAEREADRNPSHRRSPFRETPSRRCPRLSQDTAQSGAEEPRAGTGPRLVGP
jgi:hypothetical protein